MLSVKMLAIFFALISTAFFFQLGAGQNLLGTLTADSRPELSSGCQSATSPCNPFSNCATWLGDVKQNSDGSWSGSLMKNYPNTVPVNITTLLLNTTSFRAGYGWNYYLPWPSLDSTNPSAVSGLRFAGHNAQTITFNSWFPVAMLTHVNFPIYSPPNEVCNNLKLSIPFTVTYTDATSGAVSSTKTSFPVSFLVEETPNNPCNSVYGPSATNVPPNWITLANGKTVCPYGPTCTANPAKCGSAYQCNAMTTTTSQQVCNRWGCSTQSVSSCYTLNAQTDCPNTGCADRVSISGGYTNNQILTLGGKSFFMAVLGFTSSPMFNPSDTPISAFVTTENQETTGFLYARLVQLCSVDLDCDDGVPCTTDQCLSPSSSLNTGGYTQSFCYYTYDNSFCSNGCVTGVCTSSGCNTTTTTLTCNGYIAPVINCLTCSSSTGTCLVSLGYKVYGTPATDNTGVLSIEPTASNNFFTVNGVKTLDLGQPRNFYVTGSSTQVYSAGYITIPMKGTTATLTWTLFGISAELDSSTKCANWGTCITPSVPNSASLFSSVSSYLAVDSTAGTYTFWYNFTVSSSPVCINSATGVAIQSLVVKVPSCSNGITILSTTDGCYNSNRANGGTYLTSNIASLDSAISGATCLFNNQDGNMGFNGYDGFDIPLNNIGAGKTCAIGLQINYKTCPNVGWAATTSIASSGRVSFVTNKACTESCGVCNSLPLFGPISTTCAGSQPICTGDYQYLDASTCKCSSCQNVACSQSYQMDTTCTCQPCSAPTCPQGQQSVPNYCSKTCQPCSNPCQCLPSDPNCYQRISYATDPQCGTCTTCPPKANFTITPNSTGCQYTQCTVSSRCDTNYYTYPSSLCSSCIPCDPVAIAATCGPNKTNVGHPCFCTPCTATTCPDGYTLANPLSTCNSTCVPCPPCPGNSTYTNSVKKCSNGGTCTQCPFTPCPSGYAPDPANLCNCIQCPPCLNSTRTNNTWSCACTSCNKFCSTATGNVNGIDCSRGCLDPNNLCSDCIPCQRPICPANFTWGTNYCAGCQPCSVTCPSNQILNPTNSCQCVPCSSTPSDPGYVPCPANYSLSTSTCQCVACQAPSCPAPSQANYPDNCKTSCITCTQSQTCPSNYTWDGVSFCNPCVLCPSNTLNCAEGTVFVPSTQNNACPVCANCSTFYNTTCSANFTRNHADPCDPDCHPCLNVTRYPGYQVNYSDTCQPLFLCDPGVNVPACGANETVDENDKCLCKPCPAPTCATNYRPTSNNCAQCEQCPAIDCGANFTQGNNTCNPCTRCPTKVCPPNFKPNDADSCADCVSCDKSTTICPGNFSVNLNDVCQCLPCPDPLCSGNRRYNSTDFCDGCTDCNEPTCLTNFTRTGTTSWCQDCLPCPDPNCQLGQFLTVQEGGCPYCQNCEPGKNIDACPFGFQTDPLDACSCVACVAPICGANQTAQYDPCLPCLTCPPKNCSANTTLLDTCQNCTACTTSCQAGSLYTDPLDICQGCTPCPLPSCDYGQQVANNLCSCETCPVPTCTSGFELDTSTGCGCVSCANVTCPLGTVLSQTLCTCDVLTIYNQPNVTTTRCNNTDRDACGICFGNNRTCLGCDGQIGSARYVDACGVVCGTGTTCSGCTGDSCAICTAKVDLCGVCGGNSTTCDGCDGVPASGAVYDICGVCAGNGTSCLGCYGVPFGPACATAITPGQAAAVSVLAALASLGAVALALIIWRMQSAPELLFQEWDNLIQEHLTEIQANPIFTTNDTEVNPIFGQQ